MNTKSTFIYFLCFLCVVFFLTRSLPVRAISIEDLQKSIDEKTRELDAITKEIKELGTKANQSASVGQTLKSAIKTLDISANQLNTQVKLTETKISKANLNITQLGLEINLKQQKIESNLDTISKTLRQINSAENNSIIEIMLLENGFINIWNDIDTLQKFQTSIKDQVYEIRGYTKQLFLKKKQSEDIKKDLSNLKSQLLDQKSIVINNKTAKNTLLTATKNEETNYRKILAQKQALATSFENEIFNIESQIKIAIDPSRLPTIGKGVLSWPFLSSYFAVCPTFKTALGNPFCITQPFGDTTFSRTGVYNGKGHNGIDFRATEGTPITAVASGVVEETGNTDLKQNCLSYGKWVLIKHNNGLSSVYGHLSLIKARAGDVVQAGEVVGYSGSTGYAFGAHLHLSLFASQGVKVMPLGVPPLANSVNCKNVRIPIASQNAYLNPFPYF